MKNFLQKLLGTSQLLEETKRLSEENKDFRELFIKINNLPHSTTHVALEELLSNHIKESNLQLVKFSNVLESIVPLKQIEDNTVLLNQIRLTETFILKKLDTSQLGKIQVESSIVAKNDTQTGVLNLLAHSASNTMLSTQVVRGLYSTTANPETLIRYTSGLYGSMKTEGGKIASHVGFKPVSLTAMGPLLVFQAATIVTAQIHMQDISKKLKIIDKKLTALMNYHKYERTSKLKYINYKIGELGSRSFFTVEDFVLIDQMKYDLQTIKEESFQIFTNTLQEKFAERKLTSKPTIKNDTSVIDTNSTIKKYWNKTLESVSNVTQSIKDNIENSLKAFECLLTDLKETQLFTYGELAITSEKLYESLLVIELTANLKVRNLDQDRIGKIEELKQNLGNYRNEQKVTKPIGELYKGFKHSFSSFKTTRINNAFEKNKDVIEKTEQDFYNELEFLESLLDFNTQKSADNLLKAFTDNYEIVMDATNDVESVYMKRIS